VSQIAFLPDLGICYSFRCTLVTSTVENEKVPDRLHDAGITG
jgi:hypothetical protein